MGLSEAEWYSTVGDLLKYRKYRVLNVEVETILSGINQLSGMPQANTDAFQCNWIVIDGASCNDESNRLMQKLEFWVKHSRTRKDARGILTASNKVEKDRDHENDTVLYRFVHSWTLDQFKAALVDQQHLSRVYEACANLFSRESFDPDPEGEPDIGDDESSSPDDSKMDSVVEQSVGPTPLGSTPEGENTETTMQNQETHLQNEPPLKKAKPNDDGVPVVNDEKSATESQGSGSQSEEDNQHEGSESVQLDETRNLEEILAVAEARFKYSGGSARWMFNYSCQKIESKLRDYCLDVPNKQAILDGSIGPTSEASTNYFFGSAERKDGGSEFFLVSQRAVEILLEETKGRAFKSLYAFANDLENPAFLAWVVEADFFQQAEVAKDRKEKMDLNGPRSFHPVGVVDFQHSRNSKRLMAFEASTGRAKRYRADRVHFMKTLTRLVPKEGEGKSVRCKPVAWNQGGYAACSARSCR